MSPGKFLHLALNCLTEICRPGVVAREGIPFELFRSTFPGRHVARETHPRRQIARDSPELSPGKMANVVVIRMQIPTMILFLYIRIVIKEYLVVNTISTVNSMKQITKDVACLAFVDGGATTEPAIVIGTFQIDDNFLVVFDLENPNFGLSSSLLHVACLAFVDGGAATEPAIVIGTFQIDDNFLVVFDLENPNFGLSSSVLHSPSVPEYNVQSCCTAGLDNLTCFSGYNVQSCCTAEPSGLAQMATKGNLGEVVITCERSWVQASPLEFSFRSEK
nr:basic 7S globulin 2-like [Tanacetum cinerariifolium]